jgi:2-methylcitrate dehydratase PrpD
MEFNQPYQYSPRKGLRPASSDGERDDSCLHHFEKDGSTKNKVVAHPRGTGPRTLTNDQILDKYRNLTRSVISLDRQSAIEKTVLNIESVTDISSLVELLTPTVRAALA